MPSDLLVQMPRSWGKAVIIQSSSSESTIEQRSCPRVRVLKQGTLRVISSPRLVQPLSQNRANRKEAGVLVQDMSLVGIGFLYHEQLYPGEIVEIQFHGHQVESSVTRCRYIGPACFEHGGKIQSVRKLTEV